MVNSNQLIMIVVPALGYAYFSKSGINAVLINIKDLKSFNGAKALNDIIFALLYIPYLFVVGNSFNLHSFFLAYVSYSMLVYADKFLFFGTKKKYIFLNNLMYILLTIYVLTFNSLALNFNNELIYLFLLLILVISIFKIAVSTRNLKDILIVQSGNIVSTVLGVIHSGRLSGLNLTNFTLGKSIGEFPFNFLGYHLSNFIHKNGLGDSKKNIYKVCYLVLALYVIFFISQLSFYSFFKLTIGNNFMLILLIFTILFPLQIINTVFTRELQKNNLFSQGTLIQILSNSSALAILFIFDFDIYNIYIAYYYTFMFGSVCSILLLKNHSSKTKILQK